jgi:hypothetical protein
MTDLEQLAVSLKKAVEAQTRRENLVSKARNEQRFLEQTGCGSVYVDWRKLPDYVLLYARDGNARFVTLESVSHALCCGCYTCMASFIADQNANVGPGVR